MRFESRGARASSSPAFPGFGFPSLDHLPQKCSNIDSSLHCPSSGPSGHCLPSPGPRSPRPDGRAQSRTREAGSGIAASHVRSVGIRSRRHRFQFLVVGKAGDQRSCDPIHSQCPTGYGGQLATGSTHCALLWGALALSGKPSSGLFVGDGAGSHGARGPIAFHGAHGVAAGL